ncbi:MAG: DUF4333 domain-containing protein [Propionibacteriaceae bacterium]|nr:DUF4333 domain-containing protein [Propionibacteriaceae bacterium]
MRRAVICTLALLFGLSACSGGGFTESPQALANSVSTQLEQYGLAGHSIDCGEDRISIEVGKTVRCTMTVADDPMIFEILVTFTSSDGVSYTYEYEVQEKS